MASPARSGDARRGGERSIAQGLLLSSLFVASMALLLSIAAAQVLVYEPARRAVAVAELDAVADRVDARLDVLVQRVEALARLRRDWGRSGLIDIDRPAEVVRLTEPLLMRGPGVAGVAIADETGRELLLYTDAGGHLMTRETDPAARPGQAVLSRWDATGKLVSREARDSGYDARMRPWFVEARNAPDSDAVAWTAPFVYQSLQLPGMSAVVRWKGADGHVYTSSTDVTLLGLSRFTGTQTVGRGGFTAVFDADGRAVGLPGGHGFTSDAAIRAAVLRPLQELKVPALAAAYARWRADGEPVARTARFEVDGVAWLGTVHRVALGARTLYVGAYAPEADFSIPGSTQLLTLAGIVVATLILALLATRGVARRFAQPLQALAAESERIGRLELERPVSATSEWRELAAMARAQEAMRVNLLLATSGLEAAVERRTAELLLARDAADAGARAKSTFLANMSHEIRTPMNAIVGLTDLLLRLPSTSTQSDYLGKIRDAAGLLLHIVNDILDYSKIEAGKMTLERTEFLIDDVLRRVIQLAAPLAGQKKLELVVRHDPQVPDVLIGDPVRIEQVLVNLAGNAVKFTMAGEVFLGVELADDDPREVHVRFLVRDTGIGMEPARVDDLFQPFVQADPSMARRFGGSGLGLAISRRLVELMGGRIEVRSAPGRGSTFGFTLALPRADEVATESGRFGHVLTGLRMLLVDDNDVARETSAEMLRAFDVDLDVAADGAQALALFERARREGRPYRLVLLDRDMPGQDGFAVAHAMRAAAGPQRPTLLLLCSAPEFALVAERLHDEGLDGHVVKPATPSALLDALLTGLGSPAVGERRAPAPAALPSLAARRVLLVEDNEVNTLIAAELLKALGVQVTTATSAPEAIARIERGEHFDLVFMDVQMAPMDGLQATRVLRAMPQGESVVVVALTAHAMASDRARCIAAGMNDYLSKPVSSHDLEQCLRRWLQEAG